MRDHIGKTTNKKEIGAANNMMAGKAGHIIRNPKSVPKKSEPENPITTSGSKLQYSKLLRVIRILNPDTRNTRIPEMPTQNNKL